MGSSATAELIVCCQAVAELRAVKPFSGWRDKDDADRVAHVQGSFTGASAVK